MSKKDNTQEEVLESTQKDAPDDILIQPRGVKREVADGFSDPRSAAPKADLATENSLELHAMTRSERRRYRRAQKKAETADMTRSQRFHYFIDCNKWKIIGILMIVVSLAWISLAVYSNICICGGQQS